MSNRQPFHHRLEILFTATDDVSDRANSAEFKAKLATFLRRNLGRVVIEESVDFDSPATAEAGDPADLM